MKFWRNLAFLITLIQNLFILTSFPSHDLGDFDYLPEPMLFSGLVEGGILSETATNELFRSLGLLQAVCAGIITFFFILKKGPVLARKGWKEREEQKKRKLRKSSGDTLFGRIRLCILRAKKGFLVMIYVLKNVHVLYHILYMSFAVLGLAFHPFFFAYHLVEIIYRYPSLQNVIQSVVIPRKALLLTFLWTIIMIYLFSLVGYAVFDLHFKGQCTDLLTCMSVVYDQGFKASGGVGGFMEQFTAGANYINRFFYDNLYNTIVMIIMLNLVQGIIIDTFAILRADQEFNIHDKENKCFICGIDRETIERGTVHPFVYHKVHEHNEWNYVFFIFYLKTKNPAEFTGIESHVMESIAKSEIDWFPLNQAFSFTTRSNSAEAKVLHSVKDVKEQVKGLITELRDFNKKIHS